MTPEMLPFILFFALLINGYEADSSSAMKENNVISEWAEVFVQHNEDAHNANDVRTAYAVYVNFSTLRREGDIVKMWSLIDYSHPETIAGKAYLSVKSLDEYDCKLKQSRSLSYAFTSGNMGDGEALVKGSQLAEWYPIEPDAPTKILFNTACKKR